MQIGMIKLSGFNARAQQDVAQAVKQLTQQGASEFTLDVRDNRGGLYQEGAEVAKLFLEGKGMYPHDSLTPHTSHNLCYQHFHQCVQCEPCFSCTSCTHA